TSPKDHISIGASMPAPGARQAKGGAPTTPPGSPHPHPHLGRRSMGGDTLHHVLGWHVALFTWPLSVASTPQQSIRDGDARSTTVRWLEPPTAPHEPPNPSHLPWHCPETVFAPSLRA